MIFLSPFTQVTKTKMGSQLSTIERKIIEIEERIQNGEQNVSMTVENLDIYFIPRIPHGVKHLYIHDLKNLTSLPPLPATLEMIVIRNTPLKNLPDLPDSLRILDCSNINIKSLPSLPALLYMLACSDCRISDLPPLPSSLSILDCNNTDITSLPLLHNLPLNNLKCENTKITSLPPLPSSMFYLQCGNTEIKFLPPLPDKLVHLYCSNTGLTSLPSPLPKSLTYFNCEGCKIEEYPSLPSEMCFISFPKNETTPFELKDYHFHISRWCPNNFSQLCEESTCVHETPEEFYKIWKEKFDKNIKERNVKRCKSVKGDLMEKTWHPARYQSWCLDVKEQNFNSQERTVQEWLEFEM